MIVSVGVERLDQEPILVHLRTSHHGLSSNDPLRTPDSHGDNGMHAFNVAEFDRHGNINDRRGDLKNDALNRTMSRDIWFFEQNENSSVTIRSTGPM
ncbi:hypothetical protein TBK1r_46190 [Stieleria magnilauensis]|uniref:Uncharacterized protein n=1 Tax=Stieleria magnilauensis TaxID=2527963 RepID=A0ABX5XUA1_9BACT|nr:hypothetical protein TBK1r_46190 [Planctomycetes bacterium TBK1r]